MDPFSIVAGTVGLLDVCFRLTKYLNDIKEGTDKIDEDVEALSQQIAAIAVVIQSIRKVFDADIKQTGGPQVSNLQSLWEEVANNIRKCQAQLDKLFVLVSYILGKENSRHQSKLEGFRKYLRKNATEEEYNRIRTQLSGYHNALQTLLTSVNIVLTTRVQTTSDRSFSQISTDIAELRTSLKNQIASLQASPHFTHGNTLTLAAKVLPSASANEHFYTPRPVSSIFTGRDRALDQLRDWFLAPIVPGKPESQRRFVVWGLGGSGKTEFCCKFAEDNRQRFWGVFWVSASSDDNAKQSFASIAKIAKINPPTDIAGKNWLANSKQPFLLIIDNADKLENPIENYYPQAERCCILITTRNPEISQQGTCGDRHFHFTSLEEKEANELLLRAADKPAPWSNVTSELATIITKALGFLPLALVHAGRAIYNGICRIEDYLVSYERHFERLRSTKSKSNKKRKDEDYTIIYSTYETLYEDLEERSHQDQVAADAAYVLKLFSFFHKDNIRADILTQAVNNTYEERLLAEKQKADAKSSKRKTRPKTGFELLRSLLIEIVARLVKLGERPILSDLLRWDEFPDSFDDSRLRAALKELQKMSLVTRSVDTDSYSMHPVVHSWVRKRSEMGLAEQAVFCRSAAIVLSQAILLPPLALKEADEDFRRALEPHVDHVRQCERRLRERNEHELSKRRWRGFAVLQPQLDRAKCLELAKFSYVYVQCGRFREASILQYQVYNFLLQTFGMEHESTLRIASPLAGVVRQLDRINEAADLQERVLEACTALWGADDAQSLEAASALGVTRWQAGRFTEARILFERTVQGYEMIRGRNHPDTLNAMSKLAGIHTKTLFFEEAVRLHTEAVTGLLKERGPGHEDTMAATQELGMVYLERVIHGKGQPDDLSKAFQIMQELVIQRKTKCGSQHGLTLWAIANLARIKSARGDHEEAEADFKAGIPIVEQNFGKEHIGTAYGKTYYSHVLICQGKYDEAETILTNVIEIHQRLRPNHPDQLVGLSFLLKLYNLTDRQKDATSVHARIEAGLDAMNQRGHAWEQQLFDAWIPTDAAKMASPDNVAQNDVQPPPYQTT